MRTIMVQGAEEEEIALLIRKFPKGRWTDQKGYTFYETLSNGTNIIVSKTGIGIIPACIATMLGIEKYQPDYIINQGTAGGHTRELEIGDIIIGESAIYMNHMCSPIKAKGEGSNALEWIPWEAGSFVLQADAELVQIADKVTYDGKLICGRLGSGDLFSRETDRIDLLHARFGELCEDMESAAVYKVCKTHSIPVIGIRIISNNEITGKHDTAERFQITQKKLQEYIYRYIQAVTDFDKPDNNKYCRQDTLPG